MAYKNKEDQKEASKRHYDANKDIVKSRAVAFKKKARERNRAHVDEYLKSHPCIDCGEKDIIVLEFDHITDNKELEVSLAIYNCCSIKKIDEEIAKCEVRCANCHRRITHKRRNNMIL